MLTAIMILLASCASAQTKSIMEGVPSSRYTIKVDTVAGRVDVGTTSYTGGISNVGLFVASNVVVGNLAFKNACTIYSTGSVNCINASMSGSIVAGSSVTTGILSVSSQITAGSSVTASAFFGDGSHLSNTPSTTQFLSTTTFLGIDQTLNATPGVCIATATRSDWNGGHLIVNFAGGALQNSGANDKAKLSILVDSAFPSDINFPNPNNALAGGSTSGNDLPVSFSHYVPTGISAGSHSVCLVAWREAATSATLLCNSAAGLHAPCTLQVLEIK